MNKSILTVPAWKLFIAFIAGMIASELVALAAASFFDWNRHYGPYPTLRYGLMTLISWTYPYLVGRALSQRSGAHWQVLAIIVVGIFINTVSVYFTEVYGVAWYVVLAVLSVNMLCLVKVLSFPARELKSMVLKRRAQFPEYWRELVQFTLWPFFVWRLQPLLTTIKEEPGFKK